MNKVQKMSGDKHETKRFLGTLSAVSIGGNAHANGLPSSIVVLHNLQRDEIWILMLRSMASPSVLDR